MEPGGPLRGAYYGIIASLIVWAVIITIIAAVWAVA